MSGLNCTNCKIQFNSDRKVPLVLPCGDSICMECLIAYSQSNSMIYQCICWRSYELSNYFIKDLPKNKAILAIISKNEPYNVKPAPMPRVLFTPESKRNFESPDKYNGFLTPTTYNSSYSFSSPNSVALKCMRPQCNRDRYYLNGEVWDYCCINCSQLDRMNK